MKSNLKPNELKVFYNFPKSPNQPVNTALDKAIEECLKTFGFKRWASGVEIETGIRDLDFDRR